MIARTRQRHATYDDLLAVPDHLVAELVHGDLLVSPRPRFRHGAAESAVLTDIRGHFGRRRGGEGGWLIIAEPECHLVLDEVVCVPDIGGWRRERMPQLPDSHKATVVPDWVCEILSPSTRSHDYLVKLPAYLSAGVPWCWIIDVAERQVEVFRADGDHWASVVTAEGDVRVRLAPFDTVEVDLGEWWDLPPVP